MLKKFTEGASGFTCQGKQSFQHHPWQEACRKTGAVCLCLSQAMLLELWTIGVLNWLTKQWFHQGVNASNVLGVIILSKKSVANWLTVGANCYGGRCPPTPSYEDFRHRISINFSLVFSGHKMAGPSIGVLYEERKYIWAMSLQLNLGVWDDLFVYIYPWLEGINFGNWEAGTPNMAGAIGLAAAVVDYLENIVWMTAHEQNR